MATPVLGAPTSVQDYDTNGWEAVWAVVRKDNLEYGPWKVQRKAAGLPPSPATSQPICPGLGVAAGCLSGGKFLGCKEVESLYVALTSH